MTQKHAGLRRWWWTAGVLVLFLIAGAFWAHGRFTTTAATLQGAVLTPPVAAYDFRLPDQDGRMVSLAALRGKAVVLTFLYARCPDYCPLIADQLAVVHGQVASLGDRVAFVAVSVDPAGDTPEVIRTFLAAHHVTGVLSYVHGTAAQLRPVWAHYFVASEAGGAPAAGAAAGPVPSQTLSHTTIVYVIDPQGRVRVFLPANFDPKDLVTDIRVLARTAQ
jgi:protein SCO1/2